MKRPLPEAFCEDMRRMLGASEAERLFASLDDVSPVSIRLNPYKAEGGCAVAGEVVPWSCDGRYLATRPQFTTDTCFAAGGYYVQEAGSQFVDYLLRREGVEGRMVLDMCAAPGGKTTIYSTLVGEDGLVVANEYVRSRANILADNVRKWGVGNVLVTNNDPSHFSPLGQWFDVVAVDAPCSGEGMFRKDEEARAEWSAEGVKMCATRQMSILREAWQTLKAGGVLLYSTCTFNRVENEGVVQAMIDEWGDEIEPFQEVEVDASWGIETSQVGPFRLYRFFPHKVCSEGFCVAVARKRVDVGGRALRPKARKQPFVEVPKSDVAELSRWVKGAEQMRFATVGDKIYGYRRSRYDEVRLFSERLTVIYSGVAMGQIFKGLLKPDWALSQYVWLNRGVVSVAEISYDEALDYLRRRDIVPSQSVEGLNLLLHEGRPLGFVKRIGGRCNNLYPLSLKINNL